MDELGHCDKAMLEDLKRSRVINIVGFTAPKRLEVGRQLQPAEANMFVAVVKVHPCICTHTQHGRAALMSRRPAVAPPLPCTLPGPCCLVVCGAVLVASST